MSCLPEKKIRYRLKSQDLYLCRVCRVLSLSVCTVCNGRCKKTPFLYHETPFLSVSNPYVNDVSMDGL